jgi:GT2 family glycosyltransferase
MVNDREAKTFGLSSQTMGFSFSVISRAINYVRSKALTSNPKLTNYVDCSSAHEDYAAKEGTKATIIIPTRDHPEYLFACINSILGFTEGEFEIIVVDNGSKRPSALSLLEELEAKGISVLHYNKAFNFSAICNLAARHSTGDVLCFLNDDTVVTQKDWLTNLVSHATEKDAGVVGAKLVYPNQRIQHVGIALGYKGIAGLPFSGVSQIHDTQDQFESCFEVSAVAFACAVVRRDVYWEVGGLDESYAVGLNDVVFGVSALALHKRNVCCGRTVIEHVEYGTRASMFSLRGATRAAFEVLRYLSNKELSTFKENYFSWDVRPKREPRLPS